DSGYNFSLGDYGAGTGPYSPYLTINYASGNVGIGTTSPVAKLNVRQDWGRATTASDYILRAEGQNVPDTNYKLANLIGTKQENVQTDVNILANLGLIDLIDKQSNRKKRMPVVRYDVLELRVPLVAV
ncbi:MAG: hypothetical protein AABY09_01725, partial [Nanoarchaeota archaeon]